MRNVPVLVMTATASQMNMQFIMVKAIVANPDRKNITYKKIFRKGHDVDAIQYILIPLVRELLQEKIDYPLTIVYVPLRLCGFTYKLFEHVLSTD